MSTIETTETIFATTVMTPFSDIQSTALHPGKVDTDYLQKILDDGGEIADRSLAHLKELGWEPKIDSNSVPSEESASSECVSEEITEGTISDCLPRIFRITGKSTFSRQYLSIEKESVIVAFSEETAIELFLSCFEGNINVRTIKVTEYELPKSNGEGSGILFSVYHSSTT